MKVLDRVNEAYKGTISKRMEENTKERLQWICGQVKAQKILDVGCSQGMTSILLARQGCQVTGLDIEEDSIAYAEAEKKQEELKVQELLEFICDDFMLHDFADSKYDTIIMTEVLEHLIDPVAFLRKANLLLNTEGVLVITVPFGINDHPDHKRTYYFEELYSQLSENHVVKTYTIIGKWIGMVAKKNDKKGENIIINQKLLKNIEANFLKIERENLAKIEQLRHSIEVEKSRGEREKGDLEKKIKKEEQRFEVEVECWKGKYEELANSFLGKIALRFMKKH